MREKVHKSVINYWNRLYPYLVFVPLALSVWGYYIIYTHDRIDSIIAAGGVPVYGKGKILLDSVYSAIRIYAGTLDANPANPGCVGFWQIEIARWLAIIVTAFAVFKLFGKAIHRIRTIAVCRKVDTVTVHGDLGKVAAIKKAFGSRAISSEDDEAFLAKTHIVAFDTEMKMLDFLNANSERLLNANKRVYLCSSESLHPLLNTRNVRVSNVAKNCSRVYWDSYWLKKGEKRIVIIGFGRYGRYLLNQALLVNIYIECRSIEYSVFGDSESYLTFHPYVDQVVGIGGRDGKYDEVKFYNDGWLNHLNVLKNADRIILCDDSDSENMVVLEHLLEHDIGKRIDIRSAQQDVMSGLFGQARLAGDTRKLVVFGTASEVYAPEVIIQDVLINRSKAIHAYYMTQVDKICIACAKRNRAEPSRGCVGCAHLNSEWNYLSEYKKSSSMAQADHFKVKIREVLGNEARIASDMANDFLFAYKHKTVDEKRKLMKLEHDRWMRFMFLHGWTYAAARCDAEKKHNLLVEHDELSQKEWLKDEASYLVIPDLLALCDEVNE